MSHITDSTNRGSVLMEFVIVLPIYFLLMGFVFILGEMGVKTVCLASSDRAVAFDTGRSGDWDTAVRQKVASDQFKKGESANLTFAGNTYRVDAMSFNGSWSCLSAGLSVFKYRLPIWTHGWIAYPHHHFSLTTGTDPESIDGTLGKLLSSAGNAVEFIVSKETSRRYYYYTLKRTLLSRKPDAYRYREPKYLTESNVKGKSGDETGVFWYDKVYDEGYADPNPDSVDGLMGAAQAADQFLGNSPRSDYNRFFTFMEWSQ